MTFRNDGHAARHPESSRWPSSGIAHADGVAPISSTQCNAMRAKNVIHAGAPVDCARLAVVSFSYSDFDGRAHDDGRLVVLDVLAADVLAIFQKLNAMRFAMTGARPIEAFDGDDDRSMAANNTSAFNDRAVAGRSAISVHAYGAAIDLNPVQNPFVSRIAGKTDVAPPAGAAFLSRTPLQPGMAERVVAVFAQHGFTVWGGRWRGETDYQHFALDRALAARLASETPATEAKRMWAGRSGRPR